MMRSVRIIVTGCHGFIGHHVCLALLRSGHDILATDRITGAVSPKAARVKALAAAGRVHVEDLDLTNAGMVDELIAGFAPEAVIHLAGQFPIRHCREAVQSYVASNVTAWLNVAESCRLHKVARMVYASSITSKDNGKHSSMYGVTKRFAENSAYVYGTMGLSMIGLRYAAVYGPEIRRDSATWRVACDLIAGRTLRIEALGKLTPLIDIADAVEVTMRFATRPRAPGSEVHVVAADDTYATMGDVAMMLSGHLGVTPRWPAGFVLDARHGRPSVASLSSAIDFVPRITLEEGMKRFAKWVRAVAK